MTAPERDRNGCARPDCCGVIEASVPLWLTLDGDGNWSVYGVGDEVAWIVCNEYEHENHTSSLHESLSAFLDDLLPGSTWKSSAPLTPSG